MYNQTSWEMEKICRALRNTKSWPLVLQTGLQSPQPDPRSPSQAMAGLGSPSPQQMLCPLHSTNKRICYIVLQCIYCIECLLHTRPCSRHCEYNSENKYLFSWRETGKKLTRSISVVCQRVASVLENKSGQRGQEGGGQFPILQGWSGKDWRK